MPEPSEWSSSLVPVLMRRPPLGSVLRYPVRNPPCGSAHPRAPHVTLSYCPGDALERTRPDLFPLKERNPTRSLSRSARLRSPAGVEVTRMFPTVSDPYSPTLR